MEETISLQDLVKTLRKRLVLIISAVILAVTIAGIYSYQFLTPIYQVSTQILINQEKNEQQPFNSQDIQTNLQLINTYNQIIISPVILSKVIKKMDLATTPGGLRSQITVNSAQNSQVLNISVQDTDPKVAVDIANTTAEVFKKEIPKLMNVNNINILSPAVLSKHPSPVAPNPTLNMAIAAVIGMMLGVGIAFLLDYLDTTVKTESDVEELLGLPMLGLVSTITEKDVLNAKVTAKDRRKKR